MKSSNYFQLRAQDQRIRVTLDHAVFVYLAVKLDANPFADLKAARAAVRQWLQIWVDKDPGAYITGKRLLHGDRKYNSRRTLQYVLAEIADPALQKKIDDMIITRHSGQD